MVKRSLVNLARKMYSIANPEKHKFFRPSYHPDGSGTIIPWSDLAFEKDQWIEMAKLAIDATEKLLKDENVKKRK